MYSHIRNITIAPGFMEVQFVDKDEFPVQVFFNQQQSQLRRGIISCKGGEVLEIKGDWMTIYAPKLEDEIEADPMFTLFCPDLFIHLVNKNLKFGKIFYMHYHKDLRSTFSRNHMRVLMMPGMHDYLFDEGIKEKIHEVYGKARKYSQGIYKKPLVIFSPLSANMFSYAIIFNSEVMEKGTIESKEEESND